MPPRPAERTAIRLNAVCRLNFTAAAVAVALAGTLLSAAHAIDSQQDQPRSINRAPLGVQHDVANALVSEYLCLRVRPGVEVIQLADGSWSLQLVDQMMNDHGEALDGVQDQQQAIRDAFAQQQVTRIDRFMGGAFKRADLAAIYGLDRSHIVRVNPGGNVQALADVLNAADALVEFAQLDSIGTLAGIPNDSSFGLQWNMHNTGQFIQGNLGIVDSDIDAPEAWDIHTGSASTVICIIDSGVQADHPDLAGKVLPGVDTRGDNGNPPVFGTDTSDLNTGGHGTHVTGIAAAFGNDSQGVAGMNWNAKVLPVRVVDPTGFSLNQTDLSEAAIWATDNGAHVLNMSVQFTSPFQLMEDACAYAYDSGVLPVAASGNSASTSVAYPAKYPKCMGVSATRNTDAWWTSSNRGPEVDVSAPGENVYSLNRNSNYQYKSGTSMATPHVAGLASLITSLNPALTPAQIEDVITSTADDKGAAGWDENFGWGRINAHQALLAAAPVCEGNTNGDNTVNVADLLTVISAWGACVSPPIGCTGDVAPPGPPQGDGQVNVADLLLVISNWGPCP